MSKPVAHEVQKRQSTPTAIALAIMLFACGLILTALVVLAQGAVADEPQTFSQRIERTATVEAAPQGGSIVSGRFDLRHAPTTEDLALAARIESSSLGGGFVSGAEIHVTIEARGPHHNG